MKFNCCLVALLTTLIGACTTIVEYPLLMNDYLRSDAEALAAKELPLSVKTKIESYLGNPAPAFFLVADDGGHSVAWSCLKTPCEYDGVEEYKAALADCTNLRLGMDCTLLYIGKYPLSKNLKFSNRLTTKMVSRSEPEDPSAGEGKIIYLPGFSGWSVKQPNFPPPITSDEVSPTLQRLEKLGWNVDVLNILHMDRSVLGNRLDLLASLLTQAIDDAREQGYKRVVLYGGSRGGAEIMRAIDAGVTVDAIALMEPDWHGPKYGQFGQFNSAHEKRSEAIQGLLSKQRVDRIAFAFFRDSRWYGEVSETEIRSALDQTQAAYFLVAAPDNFAGHSGSWTYRFANLYSDCLHRFFRGDIDSEYDCEEPNIDEDAFENWVVGEKLLETGYRKLGESEILELFRDHAACHYSPGSDQVSAVYCLTWDKGSLTRAFTNEFDNLLVTTDIIEFDEDGYCRHNGLSNPSYGCGEVYQIDENMIAFTSWSHNSIAWYKIVDRNKVESKFDTASYRCDNPSKLDPVNCVKVAPP